MRIDALRRRLHGATGRRARRGVELEVVVRGRLRVVIALEEGILLVWSESSSAMEE